MEENVQQPEEGYAMTLDSHYVLGEEIAVTKANPREFAIHYTTYRENIFFRQSWERRVSIFGENAPCYWITLKKQRIGGVCLEPNALSSLFIVPPYVDLFRVLIPLKRFLISCSELNKPIHAYGILPYQTEHFLRLGFRPSECRRVMIRPTELMEQPEWGGELVISTPVPEQIDAVAETLYACYANADCIGYPAENSIEQQKSALEHYFKANQADLLKAASTLVTDNSSNEIVAVCLISMWEDLPLVYNIAVIPRYRSRLLATMMLKKALTVLKAEFEVLRLFVTVGNSAESLYYRLGFYPGPEQTTFQLPVRNM